MSRSMGWWSHIIWNFTKWCLETQLEEAALLWSALLCRVGCYVNNERFFHWMQFSLSECSLLVLLTLLGLYWADLSLWYPSASLSAFWTFIGYQEEGQRLNAWPQTVIIPSQHSFVSRKKANDWMAGLWLTVIILQYRCLAGQAGEGVLVWSMYASSIKFSSIHSIQ